MVELYNENILKNTLMTSNLIKQNKCENNTILKNKILLIEDNLINIKVATYLLNSLSISDIHVAQCGAEAIDLFNKYDFSLILLDIGLPDISGFDICKKIRSISQKHFQPIIAVTAFSDIKEECLSSGFDDFISKPLDLKILKSLIDKWIVHVNINSNC